MATVKSFTSVEQSRKLAGILPLESADMEYLLEQWIDEKTGHHKEGYYEIPVVKVDENSPLQQITHPCWSLAALLDLMPQHIYDELGCRTFGMVKSWDKRRYQVFYEHHTAYIQREAETAIDAVFEMIIWLKENKKI